MQTGPTVCSELLEVTSLNRLWQLLAQHNPFFRSIDGGFDTATADNSYFYYTWGDNRNRLSDFSTVNEENVRFTKISSP